MTSCSAGWALSAPVLLTLAVCVGVAFLSAWVSRQSHFPGQRSFFMLHVGTLWWLLAAALEMASQGPQCKMLWASMAWPGILAVPTFWAVFLWQYVNTERLPISLRRVWGLTLVPVLVWLLALSNPWHGLFYGPGSGPISAEVGAPIRYEHGPLFFATAVYVYLFMSFCLLIVLRAAFASQGLYRRHYLAFVALTAVPWAGNIGYVVFGWTVFGFDPTPFSFAFTLLALTWLIIGVRLFDVLPVARDLLLKALVDPVLVIDPRQRVIEANPAALQLAGLHDGWQGRLLVEWPIIGRDLHALLQPQVASAEAPLLALTEPSRYFEVRQRAIERSVRAERIVLGEMLYLRDVTQRYLSERQLAEALSLSEERLHTISALHAQLSEQALHDPLTGLFNRRYLVEFFQREQARALRERSSLALAMIDLDHFKRLNDSHGHLVGDEVLQAVAQHLQGNLRSTDAVFRIGGEEFLLILPDVELAEAVSRVDCLREQLAACDLPTRAGALRVTLSAGVALWPSHGHTLEELMQSADRALYQAKRDGRDRVLVSQGS